MTKIVQLVDNCQPCPHRSYLSGGAYWCMKVTTPYSTLPDDHRRRVPNWCPLADYKPAGVSCDQTSGGTET